MNCPRTAQPTCQTYQYTPCKPCQSQRRRLLSKYESAPCRECDSCNVKECRKRTAVSMKSGTVIRSAQNSSTVARLLPPLSVPEFQMLSLYFLYHCPIYSGACSASASKHCHALRLAQTSRFGDDAWPSGVLWGLAAMYK